LLAQSRPSPLFLPMERDNPTMDVQDFLEQGDGHEDDKREAWTLFQQAYERQMKGELEEAVNLYKRSLATHPTAEAYTFLGWTYSFMGRLDEAIEECHKAITQDPTFGNPYNDIGAYLIEKGELDEAITWFQRAMKATRYESPAFPHLNLGRVYERKGNWTEAIDSYKQALALNPKYALAKKSLGRLISSLN
jgi:tetratricopeptide (TPR) repeat protein